MLLNWLIDWLIQLLRHQLDTLHAIDESRSRVCEEVDRNAHELEKANAKLQKERQTDAETIRRLYQVFIAAYDVVIVNC